jgi:hypothetical protein
MRERRFLRGLVVVRSILAAGLAEAGLDGKKLSERPKGDKAKVKLAKQLREQTTMTMSWIAGGLSMGSWTQLPRTRCVKSKPPTCVNSEALVEE